ncbi:uncharacterized protein PgNI_08463 [Pyricularia grisea]|uniref:Uncharacterized protein n=1 Tax=Pyricularia grisea TaxID=148305 RepID=A0A6P8AVT4_PYRGI|nr:uncharacterized protein PgNI_08463 [Pyricularia grisea]TLD06336.1 hypothetical protein PgNI_08463 [Pyricularia grisea]
MHFFKTTTQVLTMFAVGIMALPTPCNIATTQKTRDIVARADNPHGINVETSTGAKRKKKKKQWPLLEVRNMP